MPNRYRWLFLALLLAGGCGSAKGSTSEEMAAWAGFTQLAGVEIVDAEDVGRLDAAVAFTLEGEGTDVDEALAAAGFNELFESGLGSVQESLFDQDIDGLASIESAADEWRNAEGQTIHRHVVRGTTGDVVVVRVEAFTT